ncbi:bifunctional diaminohydroxyphosphoribosylaminopyrimidine deaminase/5-amino-6-(5-phosphoribosylamino)uracil reductase RibD [Wenzhouxiangella sediminis]|uniref:Riboflavin biosynthesis protein RibD n=1 Tax=Wenzhouxiangella sediminis TaxID=1792836 RepID=A0A3E1K8M3_9GAMM|nr:bifunctional diaminohydroxyphosphoribosylaminopyrimidine deaminase/5-amino-6-(5-phosphoribosylamino)uracil reductase RibD [Wenzhouxiangella sediminis]RFF30448.1 bifunctional diaminohydroxyphosphoribosylaminopyrimidine deaminase/5-amino-6-(5-phosphoribosylamino)uracil reductase RibD [Wenzhouxiangella sediminis]
MSFTADDHRFMAEALRLAEKGELTADPNPAVGCVIVNDGEVVGRGWHRAAGEPHAETLALQEAGIRARGAVAYVSLEPCSHHGRTPPCANALVEAGVTSVVSAMPDPDARVSGRGHDILARAGITVRTGLMEEAARALNRGFVSRHERGRPWVRVKLAVSLDGFTAGADGRSQWITGESARADVQSWRARASCILTGIGTVLADDPRLNVRLGGFERQLTRVVVDSDGRLPEGLRLTTLPGPVIVASCVAPRDIEGVSWWQLPADLAGRVSLPALMARLAERDVNTVHVEAGPTLSGALVASGLVDELLVYQAPCLIGRGRALLELPGMEKFEDRLHLNLIDQRRLGSDWRFLYRLA